MMELTSATKRWLDHRLFLNRSTRLCIKNDLGIWNGVIQTCGKIHAWMLIRIWRKVELRNLDLYVVYKHG